MEGPHVGHEGFCRLDAGPGIDGVWWPHFACLATTSNKDIHLCTWLDQQEMLIQASYLSSNLHQWVFGAASSQGKCLWPNVDLALSWWDHILSSVISLEVNLKQDWQRLFCRRFCKCIVRLITHWIHKAFTQCNHTYMHAPIPYTLTIHMQTTLKVYNITETQDLVLLRTYFHRLHFLIICIKTAFEAIVN